MKQGIKIMCVSEKPSIAKQISQILSQQQFQKAHSKSMYNPVYEFNYNNSTIYFTSVSGHLTQNRFAEFNKFKNWAQSDNSQMFTSEIESIVDPKNYNILKNLQSISKQCQQLILFTDCDLEGEAIGEDIKKYCLDMNQQLEIKRAIFSAITFQHIQNSLQNLVTLDQNKIDAVRLRQELDLRIGSAFTRFQTVHLKQQNSYLMSYGTCQIPTLGLIYKRYLEINDFESKSLYSINLQLLHNNIKLKWEQPSNEDKDLINKIKDSIQSKFALLKEINTQNKYKQRPLPLFTLELEKQASNYLKLSSSTTMKIAESLYSQGYISYPRTETQVYDVNDDYQKKLISKLTGHPKLGEYAQQILKNYQSPRKGTRNDKAHPPIHPVKLLTPDQAGQLEPDHFNIYELIVRNFLAQFSKDLQYTESNYIFEIDSQLFSTISIHIDRIGYQEIYIYDKFEEKQTNLKLDLNKQYEVEKIILDKRLTKAKSPLNESDLLTQMDSYGIGTDATMHDHINTIQIRGYAYKNKTQFQLQELGLALLKTYQKLEFQELYEPQLRSQMELNLQKVANGELQKNIVLNEQLQKWQEIYQKIYDQKDEFSQIFNNHFESKNINNDIITCVCGNQIENNTQCSKCEQKIGIPKNVSYKQIEHKCPQCNFQILNITNLKNQSYKLCPKCYVDNTTGTFMPCFMCQNESCKYSNKDKFKIFQCEKCQNDIKIKSNRGSFFLSCSGFPNCKTTYSIPKEIQTLYINSQEKCLTCDNHTMNVEFESSIEDLIDKKSYCFNPQCSDKQELIKNIKQVNSQIKSKNKDLKNDKKQEQDEKIDQNKNKVVKKKKSKKVDGSSDDYII